MGKIGDQVNERASQLHLLFYGLIFHTCAFKQLERFTVLKSGKNHVESTDSKVSPSNVGKFALTHSLGDMKHLDDRAIDIHGSSG